MHKTEFISDYTSLTEDGAQVNPPIQNVGKLHCPPQSDKILAEERLRGTRIASIIRCKNLEGGAGPNMPARFQK